MAAGAGVIVYGVICALLAALYTLRLVKYYQRPHTPLIISFFTFIAWYISFSLVYLIPLNLDVEVTDSLTTIWQLVYWTSFSLTWVILPMIMEYYDNGGFTVKHKILLAFRQNGILVLIAGGFLIVGIIYLRIKTNLDSDGISALIKCLSNAFGLLLLVFFGGYGFVEYPRSLYHSSHRLRRRDFYYYNAANVHREAEDTRDEMAATLRLISIVERKVNSAHDDDHKNYLQMIKHEIREKEIEFNNRRQQRTHPTELKLLDDIQKREYLSTNDLIKVNHHVRKLVRHMWLIDSQWEDVVNRAIRINREIHAREDFLVANGQAPITSPSTSAISPTSRTAQASAARLAGINLTPRTTAVVTRQQDDGPPVSKFEHTIKPKLFLVACVICAMASALMLYCEVTLVSDTREASPLAMIIKSVEDSFLGLQILTLPFLVYLTVCVYFPLFQLRLNKFYYMGKSHSDTNSLIYCSTAILRVSTTLAFNFTKLLYIKNTSLESLIGQMEAIAFFGQSFNQIFPIFMLIVSVLVFFHAFGRILSCLNIHRFQFVAKEAGEANEAAAEIKAMVAEGKSLVNAEKRRREREGTTNGASDSNFGVQSKPSASITSNVNSGNMPSTNSPSSSSPSRSSRSDTVEDSASTSSRVKSAYKGFQFNKAKNVEKKSLLSRNERSDR